MVAVDPTSPFTGGALLGDRIRMESVALDPGVFIRSMATRGSLGGLATTTREVCDVLDAGGFDRILIETVGVGQSELDVARMCRHRPCWCWCPNRATGSRRSSPGVMEIADIFVVNKADRPGADKLRQEIEVTLGIRPGQRLPARAGASWRQPRRSSRTTARTVDSRRDRRARMAAPRCSPRVATKGEGIDELVERARRATTPGWNAAGDLARRRRRRLLDRTREVVDRATRQWVWEETGARAGDPRAARRRGAGRVSPYEVADEVLDALKQGSRV